jgi:hypothetical protein
MRQNKQSPNGRKFAKSVGNHGLQRVFRTKLLFSTLKTLWPNTTLAL